MATPTFHYNKMSEGSLSILQNAMRSVKLLEDQKIVKVASSNESDKEILFATAKAKFPSLKNEGFGIFSISSDDNIPTIWKKEVFENEKTGEKEEWLVAYTTDDDNIARSVMSFVGYEDQGMPESAFPKGTRVLDRSRGLHGQVVNDARPGIDNKTLVHFDETGAVEAVDSKSLEAIGAKQDVFDTTKGKCKGCGENKTLDDQTHLCKSCKDEKEKKSSLSTTAADQPTQKQLKAPIAPGVVTKNLTIDQTGVGGTATVTVNFNDPNKGEQFFKSIEDLTGDLGGGNEGGGAPPKQEEPTEPKGNPQEQQAPAPTPVPAARPTPGAPVAASSIKNLTTYGQKVLFVNVEKFSNYPSKYYFVNEGGNRVDLNMTTPVKLGTQIRRPDTGELIRVQNYVVSEQLSDDDDLITVLAGDAVSDFIVSLINSGKYGNDRNTLAKLVSQKFGTDIREATWKVNTVLQQMPQRTMASSKCTTCDGDLDTGGKCINCETKRASLDKISIDIFAIKNYVENLVRTSPLILTEDDITHRIINKFGLDVIAAKNLVRDILKSKSSLEKLSIDISDKVPPMGWTNKDSQNKPEEMGDQGGLPPNPALNNNAPPTADTANGNPNPLYDSTQDSGQKGKFNMSVNPNDNSVTVKFDKSPALQAIDQAVNDQQPVLDQGVTPQQQPPQNGQEASPAAPNQKQPQQFENVESPVQF